MTSYGDIRHNSDDIMLHLYYSCVSINSHTSSPVLFEAYKKILWSHQQNLELNHTPEEIYILKKEIFRIFADCMNRIYHSHKYFIKEVDPKWIFICQFMSVSLPDDHLPCMLNCFCRILQSNYIDGGDR